MIQLFDKPDLVTPDKIIFDRIFLTDLFPKHLNSKTYITIGFGDYRPVKGGSFKSEK